MTPVLEFNVPKSGSATESVSWFGEREVTTSTATFSQLVFVGAEGSVQISDMTDATTTAPIVELTWGELEQAAELTSFRFLHDEPEIYGEDDGEPL